MVPQRHSKPLDVFPGFRAVPRTGVIYVMTEAAKHGFRDNRDSWSNLGQGAPETGPIENAPDRVESLRFTCDDHEYAPVVGLLELREAVAELYNQRYRVGKASQYSYKNVAICSGGRLALTRVVSTIGNTNVGHFLPDYTAYEELLDSFSSFVPIPILLEEDNNYQFSPEQLRREILGRGLSSVLLSNPSNPTSKLVHGEELKSWVDIARELECALIFDEFYSHYIYDLDQLSVSAAEYVQDVNKDPIVLFDGLTKNWRYPGFRVSWTVGPESVIDAIASAGSFIDGGCARPMQLAALDLVKKETADREARALKSVFGKKRDLMRDRLEDMGIVVNPKPEGSFYCWADLSKLPEHLNTGMELFENALEKNVVFVPGVFFDINPGHRRPDRSSRFGHCARFSFGPPLEELERGLDALESIIKD